MFYFSSQIKSEPGDDKNNDSGVSPGHSSDSVSTTQCRSPESLVSQEDYHKLNMHESEYYNSASDSARSSCGNSPVDPQMLSPSQLVSAELSNGEEKTQLPESLIMSPYSLDCLLCKFSTSDR